MVYIIPDLERHVAHMNGVHAAIAGEAKEREQVAHGLLEEARASTTHHKIIGPGHLTFTSEQADPETMIDSFFSLNAPSPKSIEYGHMPSGVFDPDKYGSVTKAPEGLYILHRAAGLL